MGCLKAVGSPLKGSQNAILGEAMDTIRFPKKRLRIKSEEGSYFNFFQLYLPDKINFHVVFKY